MKKYIIITIAILVYSFHGNAQTSAFDYTKLDCNGVTHNLYTTLDQGNVVVLIYEHRCPSCLTGANNIKNVINNYYSSNTNIKVWYLENGGGTCTVVNNWITTNTLIAGTVFQYSSDFSSPYGSAMPVIVIAAGPAHNTYLVSLGASTVTDIHNAIEAALLSIGIDEISLSLSSFNVYPNPVNTNSFTLLYNSLLSQIITIELYDIEGKLVQPSLITKSTPGENSIEINVTNINNGIYFVKLKTNDGFQLKKIFINR